MQIRTTRFYHALGSACVAAALSLGISTSPVQAQTAAPAVVLPDFSQIVEQTEKSVVNIRTTESIPVRPMRGGGNDPYDLFRWFFGPDVMPHGPGATPRGGDTAPQEERVVPRGVGSGFIISNDGYILTNNHVIADAKDIFVTLVDGKEYKAKVIGADERTDVALIKVEANDLPPLKIGNPGALKKGQWVMAIGSPFGLDSTVTVGIVSAINRDTGDYLPFIQTDVAVNPGNSGGPLLNLSGEVVGVNSQIISRSGGFMGISLAIPIDEAMNVVEQLKAHGRVTRGRIGVQITDVSEEVAKALGLKDSKGALVSNVEENGPAAKAGIRNGDVILRFGDKDIKQMSDLPRIVGSVKPGTQVDVEVWRKGKTHTVKAEVGELTTGTAVAAEPQATASVDRLGLQIEALAANEQQRLGISGGVKVKQAAAPASAAGIAEGDIIVQINNHDDLDVGNYERIVKSLSANENVALLVVRGNNAQWVVVKPTAK
ncbi:Do family serine endopeptidase [Paenalcaligenes hominis]|uniref:Probable periplasmic serine endoprotease DegP-like n=1 Tax=Paenalcaligenes hominis TaxID=643674 RepID=A0ABX0WPI5_9BURK|nr:Do family serine endopeptidase [Paenalcaligenes hominis]NJB63857.1 serine protease Do [Paenalcaligenes hominis]GGE61164.1 serine protease [Paenalcaligenes hominis]